MGLFDRLFGRKKEETEEILSEGVVSETLAVDTDSSDVTPVQAEVAPVETDEAVTDASTEEPEGTQESGLEVEEPEQVSAEVQPQVEEVETPSQSAQVVAYYVAKEAAANRLEQAAETGESVAIQTKSEAGLVEVEAPQEDDEVTPSETQEEKYSRSLKKTRTGFGAKLNEFFANFRTVDEDFFEELEELLILSDVGVKVASTLTEDLRYEAKLENAKSSADLRRVVIEKLVDIYEKDGFDNEKINLQDNLTVMLFVGVNGVGKTTSIGKLAYKYKQAGK